jgi:hypothetical protein
MDRRRPGGWDGGVSPPSYGRNDKTYAGATDRPERLLSKIFASRDDLRSLLRTPVPARRTGTVWANPLTP